MENLYHMFCTQTHSFAHSHAFHKAAVSSSGFNPSVSTNIFYVLAAGVVAVCVFLFFLCFPAVASDDSSPGFPT